MEDEKTKMPRNTLEKAALKYKQCLSSCQLILGPTSEVKIRDSYMKFHEESEFEDKNTRRAHSRVFFR